MKSKMLAVRIDTRLHEELTRIAAGEGCTLSHYIRTALAMSAGQPGLASVLPRGKPKCIKVIHQV